jgi:hypothetical protein
MVIMTVGKRLLKKSDENASHQHWVLRYRGRTEVQSAVARSLASVQAGRTSFNIGSYLQQNIFNRQRLPADGIQIPRQPKALPVSGQLRDDSAQNYHDT